MLTDIHARETSLHGFINSSCGNITVTEAAILMRDQLRLRLSEAWPELEILGEAKNGEEAVELVEQLNPDLTFLDIRMPGQTGLARAPDIRDRRQVVFVNPVLQAPL